MNPTVRLVASTVGLGLVSACACVGLLWNLGWLWRAAGLPVLDSATSNVGLGAAVVALLVIAGTVLLLVGVLTRVVFDAWPTDTEKHS